MNSFIAHIVIINLLDLAGVFSAKYYSLSKNPWLLLLTTLFFAGAGFFFARSLRFEDVAIVNVLWITLSVLLVTLVGHFVFKEIITVQQWIGIFVILFGLALVTLKLP